MSLYEFTWLVTVTERTWYWVALVRYQQVMLYYRWLQVHAESHVCWQQTGLLLPS